MRKDSSWFASALRERSSRALPLWNSRNLIAEGEPRETACPRAAFMDVSNIPDELRNDAHLMLLGQFGGTAVFAYEIESLEPPQLQAGTRFEDLRVVAALLPAEEAGLLSYARGMVAWRARHRFCGTCGATTLPVKGGHVLVCTNPACRHEQFPRIDPAIIVLVSDGERALLGRQASWPVGRYSTIAGFVEPGESLEDAVAREVFEETGIEVDEIEYHSSQPWPFPSSLMLGFTARAVSSLICKHDDELDDVQWFTRADLAAGKPIVPPSVSISFRLIEHWFDAGGGGKLKELQKTSTWISADRG